MDRPPSDPSLPDTVPPLFEVLGLRIAVHDERTAHSGVDNGLTVGPGGPPLGAGWVEVVPGVDFSVRPGEVLAIVGESGSGKTISLMGALGLLGAGSRAIGGSVSIKGLRTDLWADPVAAGRPDTRKERRRRKRRLGAFMGETLDPTWRQLMGAEVGVLFQDPISGWSPVSMIGEQTGEVLAAHTDLSQTEIQRRVLDALGEVKLPPQGKFLSFRHELSRGESQRAMLAAALIRSPSLLVADEPLSGLDAPVAAAILSLIKDMRDERGLAMIFVTHDLAAVASIADRVAVMYGGRIIEEGPVGELFRQPHHPYTEGLLGSIPWPGVDRLRPIQGQPPRLVDVPHDSCTFAPRCPYAIDACRRALPTMTHAGAGSAACIRTTDLNLRGVPRSGTQ